MYSRLAEYEGTNDAVLLASDPAVQASKQLVAVDNQWLYRGEEQSHQDHKKDGLSFQGRTATWLTSGSRILATNSKGTGSHLSHLLT